MAKLEHLSATDVYQRSTNGGEDMIVTEILPRLHIKALFNFSCVSKRYKTIISHPNFGRNYMRNAYNISPELSGLLPSKTTMLFPFMDLSHFSHIFNMDFTDLTETIHSSWSGGGEDKEEDEFGVSVNSVAWLPYCDRQKLLASSNGLILSKLAHLPKDYTSNSPRMTRFGLCVWNPLTKHCIKIPDLEPLLRRSTVYTLAARREATTAAAFLTYKVVAISTYWKQQRFLNQFSRTVAVFSSDTGCWATWKPFCPRAFKFPDLEKAGGFAYKGVLHWLDNSDGTMLTYDPYNSPERFDRIPLPNDNYRNSSLIYSGEEEMLKYCEVLSNSTSGFDSVLVWCLVDASDSSKPRWCFEGEFQVLHLGYSRKLGCQLLLVAPNPWNRDLICHP